MKMVRKMGLAPCVALVALVALIGLAAPSDAQDGASEPVRALIAARVQSTLSSEIGARIAKIPVEEGARFEKGALLVAFDCAVQRAERQKAQADLWGANREFEAKQKLAQRKAASTLEVQLAEAQVRRAKAEAAIMNARVRKCAIKAPFAGRVVELHANPFESVTPGQPLMKVLDDSALKVEMLVPSAWVSWLAPGVMARIRIDETGRDYRARVTGVGAAIDPVSQMLEVYAEIDGDGAGLLAGMSGTAVLRPDN